VQSIYNKTRKTRATGVKNLHTCTL